MNGYSPSAVSVWLERPEAEQDPEQPAGKPIEKLVAALGERQGDQPVRVQVHVPVGQAIEPVWLRVTARYSDSANHLRLIAELESDVTLLPELRADEPFLVEQYNIVDWK